jgi:uncharacterized protein YceK
MKLTSHFRSSLQLLALTLTLICLGGCATIKHTEQTLTEAGFQRIAASTDTQAQHLLTLPPNKLTLARINGKAFYVFPDAQHHQIFVGNEEAYQTYQQILTYSQIAGESRVLAYEDEGPGDDAGKWVQWTSDTGWTHGTTND